MWMKSCLKKTVNYSEIRWYSHWIPRLIFDLFFWACFDYMHKIPILLVSTLCYAAFGWIWVHKLYEHPCCCFCLWQWNRRQMPVTLAVTHALAATEAPHSFTDEVVCFRSWTFRFSFSLYFCLFVTLTEVYFFNLSAVLLILLIWIYQGFASYQEVLGCVRQGLGLSK